MLPHMFLNLVLLFTLIPALELYLLFKVGGMIGGGNTILIIIATGFIGATLAKAQGISILNDIQKQTQSGQIPTKELVHGLLILAGGLLLLTPGFFTDIIGFSLVIPGSRHLLCVSLTNWFKRKVQSGEAVFQFYQFNNFSNQNNSDIFQSDTIPDSKKSNKSKTVEAEFVEVNKEKK